MIQKYTNIITQMIYENRSSELSNRYSRLYKDARDLWYDIRGYIELVKMNIIIKHDADFEYYRQKIIRFEMMAHELRQLSLKMTCYKYLDKPE